MHIPDTHTHTHTHFNTRFHTHKIMLVPPGPHSIEFTENIMSSAILSSTFNALRGEGGSGLKISKT